MTPQQALAHLVAGKDLTREEMRRDDGGDDR